MANETLFQRFVKQTDLVFTFALFGIILLLILPIPSGLMDLLLALNIGISLLILLIINYLKDPSEFTIFPTLLLTVTLFRLGLNIASTRLILLEGYAGNVIDSFGNFVVRGNYVVGGVVFLILIVVNFVVITKGAGRIAEVAARFTLDAMPGKQMAIDAELNSGLIDEAKATQRRQKIQKEADFYGAMDGASKFVRGDAIAGLLITFINVVGGITIGILQKHIPLMQALQQYTLLSIGDGIVSQVPALIVSVGAGMLITRTGESSNLSEHLEKQLLFSTKAIYIVSVMMALFAIMPGMPFIPFISLSIALILLAHNLKLSHGTEPSAFEQALDSKSLEAKPTENNTTDANEILFDYDILSIELGHSLIPFMEKSLDNDLPSRVSEIRKKLSHELGFFIPSITIKDNFTLEGTEYRFLLRDKVLASSTLEPTQWLAMSGSDASELPSLKGKATKEPVFGLPAWWIDATEKERAESAGYVIVNAISILITHLSEVLKKNAYLLLGREDTQKLIDNVKNKNPTLVSELFPDLVNVGLVQRVLQNLLKEGISLKNLPLILEAIGDCASVTKHPDDLSEQARRRLGMYFVEDFVQDHFLSAIILDPELEHKLISQVKRTQFEIGLMMEPSMTQEILRQLTPLVKHMTEQSMDPIVLTSAELRLAFKRFFEPTLPNLTVLSYQELPNDIQIKNYGLISGGA